MNKPHKPYCFGRGLKIGGLVCVITGIVCFGIWRAPHRGKENVPENQAIPGVLLSEPAPVRNRPAEEAAAELPVSAPGTDRSLPDPCSESVRIIVSSNTPFSQRMAVLQTLGRHLSADDIHVLCLFLHSPLSDSPGLRPIALNALKNDVLETLLNQSQIPEGMERQIVDMFSDPDVDEMWREYCLQFIGWMSEQRAVQQDAAIRSAAVFDQDNTLTNVLFSALDRRSGDFAGTALLALNRLSKKDPGVSQSEVLKKAVEVAGDVRASDRCRLTALRIASEAGVEEILPIARKLSADAKTDLLKAAALVSLGDFHREEDRKLLNALAASQKRQIASAASAALQRFPSPGLSID